MSFSYSIFLPVRTQMRPRARTIRRGSWLGGSCLLALSPALFALFGCHRAGFPDVPPGYREFAYVANSASNTVSVLDLVYLRPDRTLQVGQSPVALAVNPVRHEVYAVNRDSGSVSVIQAVTNQAVATIPVRRLPTDIVVTADGRRAFVTNSGSSSLSVIDLDQRREIATIPAPPQPAHLKLSPDARSLVLSTSTSGTVAIYAVAPPAPLEGGSPLQLRASFSGCPGASDLAILPDSSKVFVACAGGHQVAALALAAAPKSWAARQDPSLLTDHLLAMLEVGEHPTHLALKPDGGEIFVANSASDSISEIATTTNEVGGTYTIASHPDDLLVDTSNATLWIGNAGADNLGIYSIDDGRLTGSVRTGSSPGALAFSRDDHLLLVANALSGDVAVIRTTGQSGPALFTMLPAGSHPAAVLTMAFLAGR